MAIRGGLRCGAFEELAFQEARRPAIPRCGLIRVLNCESLC